MNVAVSAAGSDLNASVDSRFGRCPWFLFVDGATLNYQAVENKSADDSSGAGTACAQLVLERGVDAVISGRVGPNAYEVLKEGGVKVFIAPDSMDVREALTKCEHGELQEMAMKLF
jgi:predicted Fe-Mo cluster-binding NifX family protein